MDPNVFIKLKIKINVKLRENYNLMTYKAYNLKDNYEDNLYPYEKLILYDSDFE